MKPMLALAAAALWTACTFTPPTPPPAPVMAANPAEYAPYLQPGDAVVSGQVFMKTRGGDVKVGAGYPVYLDPVTTYARAWWRGRDASVDYFRMASPDTLFTRARHQAIVGAQGQFEISGLAPGWYFAHSAVTWEIGGYYPTQGGVISDSVLVQAGKTVQLVLTE